MITANYTAILTLATPSDTYQILNSTFICTKIKNAYGIII